MYAVIATEITAEDTANIFINRYIPFWGCPCRILSDNDLQVCSKLSRAVYKLFRVWKIATSSCHTNTIGGVERTRWSKCWQWWSSSSKHNWEQQLPHVEFAYSNSVSTPTGLAPNEVHMGRLPRSPLTIFERTGVAGYQS